MAVQQINTSDSATSAVDKINANFNELAHNVTHPQYGSIGTNYPEEIEDIVNILDKNGASVRFVHVSDNHQDGACKFAMDLVDATGADFFVNTGDIVTDKFSDAFGESLKLMTAMTKPAFLTLGNHDCYRSPSVAARFEKYFGAKDPTSNKTLHEHNGLAECTNTYYSYAKYTTGGVRCIFLDMCDAVTDANYQNEYSPNDPNSCMGMNKYLHEAKMSAEQINWFINELKLAKSKYQSVACFIHVVPGSYDNLNEEWSDGAFDAVTHDSQTGYESGGTNVGVHFLADIVDAFIGSTTFSVTHNGTTFSDTFGGQDCYYNGTLYRGMFAGWFAGHTHSEFVGRLYGHPKQHFVIIGKPNSEAGCEGAKRTPTPDLANYVTIANGVYTSRVCVYRIGAQKTRWGTVRKSFSYRF